MLRSSLLKRVTDPKLKLTTPTTPMIETWLREQPMVCYYSGVPVTLDKMHVDHKKPLTRGGTNELKNLCLTTAHMNLAKGNMTEKEFKALIELVSTWEDKGKALFTRLKMGHFK
jgi:5-methylcytosine-specific restriction endonuclease McrA